MQEYLDVLLGDSGRSVSTFELLSSQSVSKLASHLTGAAPTSLGLYPQLGSLWRGPCITVATHRAQLDQ